MKMRNLVFLCAHGRTIDKCAGNDQYLDVQSKENKRKFSNFPEQPNHSIEYENRATMQRPNLERLESLESQTSGIEMRISQDQDLGSDAESLPSCEESITASDSPPNSPQLYRQEMNRRESAPANLNIEALKDDELNAAVVEQSRENHRRYSSVEERTNRVRFNLEASFKEEEDKYNRQVQEDSEHDLLQKFKDIEDYKVCMTSAYPTKVSSPPCLSCDIEEQQHIQEQQQQIQQQKQQQTERKQSDSNDRSRKSSVYSDHSGSIHVMPGQSIRKYSSKEQLDKEEEKVFKRATSVKRRQSKNKKNNDGDTRKYSLQDYSSHRRSYCEGDNSRKFSLQMFQGDSERSRKFSLQIPKRKPSFSDRKLSLQEKNDKQRKTSSQDSKSYDRSSLVSERKFSSPERKTSSQESRKTSLTETFRAVVGNKKKNERKQSVETIGDENNNLSEKDKKSAWCLIKNKIKKERKTSNDLIQTSSPQMFRLLSRNDSSSSVDSGIQQRKYHRSDSHGKHSPRFDDSDQKSISSFTSVDTEDQDNQPEIVPRCAFDLWSEGKVDIDTESSTLPLLHVAAGEGNIELIKTLLDVGVDTNEKDQCGWPALHYAICSGHFECAQLLLSKGAALENYSNKVMNFYCTAVRDCIRMGSPYNR